MFRHVLVGSRQQQTPVCDVGVAGPDLVAVNDILVALAGGRSGQRREIGAGAWLGKSLAPALGAVDHAGQESLLKFLAAVVAKRDDEVSEAGPCRRSSL